jgi:ribosomal protein S18 acetylase RimI-like enzyme
VQLVRRAYRDPRAAGWTTEAGLVDGPRTGAAELAASIDDPLRLIVVAEDVRTSQPVGCCQLAREPGGDAHFGLFAVDPSEQSRGLGGDLLDEAERRAREEWGAEEIRLLVLEPRSELIAWYRRRGYQPLPSRVSFREIAPSTEQPIAGDLHFVGLGKRLRRDAHSS